MLTEARRALLLSAVRDAAAQDILPRFRRLTADQIGTKSGPADLVTIADREAEARITASIAADWPEALVVGEEAVSANPTLLDRMDGADWAVVVDPVDGTWNFANGLAVFGVIVAVQYRGQTVWGVIYDPLMDDWVEVGDNAWFMSADGARTPLTTSATARAKEMTGFIPLFLFPKQVQPALGAAFARFGRVQSLRCSAHEYRLLAQGRVEFVLSAMLNPWDHLAGVHAARRAGGVARLLTGEDYTAAHRQGPLLVAGSDKGWHEVADILRPILLG